MRAVFLPAGIGPVLSNPHWEYTRIKITKTRPYISSFLYVSAAPTNTTSSASQETIVKLLDLSRLNELCLTSNFDKPQGR
jgi:hypothetical protein